MHSSIGSFIVVRCCFVVIVEELTNSVDVRGDVSVAVHTGHAGHVSDVVVIVGGVVVRGRTNSRP